MTLAETFRGLKSVNVLVIGDVVLDLYTLGSVERVSPEAPVPVLLVKDTHTLPGMAGNVALNLQALGAQTTLVGRIGNDGNGFDFIEMLQKKDFSTEGIFTQAGMRTPLKNRFIAQDQQLIRADFEKVTPIDPPLEKKVKEYISKELPKHDIVALSDYGKGFLSDGLIKHVMKVAAKQGIPVIVDPKGADFKKYSGAFMIKPNQKEAYAASGLAQAATIKEVAKEIWNEAAFDHLLVTRSEKGMSLVSKKKNQALVEKHFPVESVDVNDVTGAGDTALAMIAFALGNGLSLEHSIELANIASGIAVGKLGCVFVTISEIAKRLLDKDPQGKIYEDVESCFVLDRTIEDHRIILLNLGEEDEISIKTFNLIREIHQQKDGAKLAVHILPNENNRDFICLLASMYEVDFVIVQRISSEKLTKRLSVETTIDLEASSAVGSKPTGR